MRARIHKGVLECDKGDGKYVPQLCVRALGAEIDPLLTRPQMCNTSCPLLDGPCNKKGKSKCSTQHFIAGCEFEIYSEIPIEFDKEEQITPKCGRL